MSVKFAKILCPVDFEPNSAAALAFAGEIADSSSTLHFLHVIPNVDRPGFEHYPPVSELAQESLENFVRQNLRSGLKRELIVRVGDPAQIIVDLAKELAVDLIVMATHGHKGVARLILGSVAERVVREARQPVLTLRPDSALRPKSA